jgi:hypothetical protein
MAQKPRTIHPGDTQDERLAALPLSAAYTYAYLPTVLDDEGRAKDQPAVFNGYLWPLRVDEHGTDAMVRDIAALVEAGLLCRYSVGDDEYVHDPRWRSRQKIARPVASTLPACPVHDKTVDDVVAETLTKVTEQVNAFLGAAAANIDETRIRDSVARIVEDVTFLIDPEKAAAYGQKVRGLFARASQRGRDAGGSGAEVSDAEVWDAEVSDAEVSDAAVPDRPGDGSSDSAGGWRTRRPRGVTGERPHDRGSAWEETTDQPPPAP